MKRKIYLDMKPLAEARRLFLDAFSWPALAGVETIDAADALDRVTAAPVFAVYSSPAYHGAAMDGVAVRAADTFAATDERPVTLALGEGAHAVDTGEPLPAGCDAVVMIEQVHQPDAATVELRAAAFPWQHVRRVGEDVVAQELMFPHHYRLAASDVAALLSAGALRVSVRARPRVAIVTTGPELVDWRDARDGPPPAGRIIDSNATLLASLVSEAGGVPIVVPRPADSEAAVRDAVAEALASDVHAVVLNAGASAGSKDYSVHVAAELGEVLVHGVAVMPGKPTILARAMGKPLVGTPGYPVSAWVAFDQFLGPALALMQGREPPRRQVVSAVPARRLASKLGQEEFLRVHLGRVGERVVATPLKRGAGAITSLTRADGILRIAADSEGLDEGQAAPAELLRPVEALEDTLVVIGSHDVSLDLLADHMRRRAPSLWMSSSHLGSLAGIMAIKAGHCHLGGMHLLDPESGTYNVAYLQRHLAGVPVRLVTLAHRAQGFIVPRGNPKGIAGFGDLVRDDVAFINRQGGSGTRVLLDYHLAQQGVDPAAIVGYRHDEYTHMAVAVAVLSGAADVGLGIAAAARALDLDFVPVATERYDLCIPVAFLDDPRVRVLLETLGTAAFQREVEALGGYDIGAMGQTAWESE